MADGNSDWRREDDDEGEQEIDETVSATMTLSSRLVT